MFSADNAVIMAAGKSTRLAPLSLKTPKGLLNVRGEILIERQISQLKEAGINDIIIVVGYMKESFYYLGDFPGVRIIENKEFETRNNHSSIYAIKDYLNNSFVCSADNYFTINPFSKNNEDSYYSCVFKKGQTDEWCVTTDKCGYINSVKIGGKDSLIMLGHTFWSKDFSKKYTNILESVYSKSEIKDKLWEAIFTEHLDSLKMMVKKYNNDIIYEFDTLDELKAFDPSYDNIG